MPDNQWHLQETYKGLITLCVEALKMLALINGGAAVALLTYMGNVVGHGGKPHDVMHAMYGYCAGLALTALAAIIAYVTQLMLYDEERRRAGDEPYAQRHPKWLLVALLMAVSSVIAFGYGCLSAASAIGSD